MTKKSFWIDKPVKINENFNQILSNKELLESSRFFNINNEINTELSLEYKVLKNIDPFKMYEIITFINKNYVTSIDNNHKLVYTKELFSFYANEDSLIIEFFHKKSEKIIGYIIGKKETIYTNIENINQTFKSLEVNFLCIIPQLRNLGISGYMINVLTYQSILLFELGIAHYTIFTKIKSPHFGLKNFYHRIINVDKLIKTNFLSHDTDTILYKKLFNTFEKTRNKIFIEYINTETYTNEKNFPLIKELYNKYIEYCKKLYIIWNYISLDEFTDTFNNKAFHHFIIRNVNNHIISYISMFQLDTLYVPNNMSYKNGYLFNMFFNTIDIFENVYEYIYKNNIFDLITFADIFNINYDMSKYVRGSGLLRYYLFNHSLNHIENFKNGLITI